MGLFREMTKASFLGTSRLADAFGIAFMIPNLFRRLFAENSISVAFIPTFRAYLSGTADDGGADGTLGDSAEAASARTQQFISATFTLVTFLTAAVTVAGMCFALPIVRLFADNSNPADIREMALLTRIMFPYLFVISVAAFFQGILNGVKIFAPSGCTPILFNVCVIGAAYLLSPHTANPARAMAAGVVIGGVVQALFQLPFVLKTGWKITFTGLRTAFSDSGTRRVMRLIGPTIIGMAAYQLNDVVSTALAGQAGSGIVSSLQYSLRLQELILGIFAVSVGTVILPDLSAYAKQKDWERFNAMFSQAMRIIAFITIPITIYALIEGKEIITLVYKNKRFTDESVALTLEAFVFHIAGLFFIALNRIIAPAFYAQGDTKSPTAAGIFGFAVNIVLALLLVHPMRGGGIALALSIASFANTVLLFLFLKKSPFITVSAVVVRTALYSLKMLAFSAAAALPVLAVKPHLSAMFAGHNRFIAFGIPVILTAVIFAAAGMLLIFVTGDSTVTSIFRKRK
ncbi:MAG: murein biosynthesis integral membrane protein MurJ [Bacteroides sp.]|nr:murein biosynthesis integral membrane protein MurJ [Prevotella sp.]MCM1470741.1 murein biosynthesis integral membrane protein MurJ [Bacteroides sp.]